MINSAALRGILVLFVMKQCLNIVETSYSTMDPAFFRKANFSETDSGGCKIQEDVQGFNLNASVTNWIFAARYFLPVLGGLMSCAWLGYIRVLQIGGVVMLLATVLMSVSVYLGFICQESSPIVTITWLLLPLFFSLAQPSAMYGFYLWYDHHPLFPSMIPLLYYLAAESGELIALLMSPFNGIINLGNHYTLLTIGLSLLFILLSFFLPEDTNQGVFEIPPWPRMRRYCIIFSGLVLVLLSVGDMRAKFYMVEMVHYMNGTTYFDQTTLFSPEWISHCTKITGCLILMIFAVLNHKKLPVHPRLQSGILLESAVAICLVIFTAVGSANPTAVAALYSVLSVVDGMAELLVMIAIYDLVQLKTPTKLKAIVFGIVFTEWGLSDFVSECFVIGLGHMSFWVYHLIILGALIICSMYYGFLAMPLAEQMILVVNGIVREDEDVYRPLLDPNSLA